MKKRLGSILGSGSAGVYLLAGLLSSGCGGEQGGEAGAAAEADPSGHGHAHEVGPNGGEVLGLGSGEVHVELVLDDRQGRIDLYVLGADGKAPLEVASAPAINLRTAEGPRQFASRPAGGSGPASHFELTDPVFTDHHLEGQLVVRALGKEFFAALPSHDEEDGAAHTHPENAIALTVWTATCEWFVELEVPEAGKPAAFAAHLTLLDSFQPVTVGELRVEASGSGEQASTRAGAPARPGIFTPSITFPAAGEWTLRLVYEGQALEDAVVWSVTVHEPGQAPPQEDDPGGLISFLKEQQWKTRFATTTVETGDVLTVPASAILADAGERVVFVQLGGESFERRVVETGVDSDGRVEIRSGLKPGERIATKADTVPRQILAD